MSVESEGWVVVHSFNLYHHYQQHHYYGLRQTIHSVTLSSLKPLHMKRVLFTLLMGISMGSTAQTWAPKTGTVAKSTKVQCWGTTAKHQRCKRMIDPAHPASAVKDAGGVYYCAQHAKQAK